MNDFLEIFKDPKEEIFWTALGVILTFAIILGGIFNFIFTRFIKNAVSDKTKRIIDGQVELFTSWVKIRSRSQKIDDKNVEEWLSSLGGVINLGRDYKIYKTFIARINNLENKKLTIMPEDKFNIIIKNYDTAPKYSRAEW